MVIMSFHKQRLGNNIIVIIMFRADEAPCQC